MITTPQGFDLQAPEPLDGKMVQATIPDANTLVATRYVGLTVYALADNNEYIWNGSTWLQKVTNGYPTTQYVTVGGIGNAGRPILLNASGLVDDTMIAAGDTTAFYRLDGTRSLTADMPTAGFKLVGLGPGTQNGDSVRFEQLSGYLTVGGTAANATQLNSQAASYYLDAGNLTGTLPAGVIPTPLAVDITGNSATATRWATSRTLTLTGDVSGIIGMDGSANVSMSTSVANDSHTHTVGNITGTSDVFNRSFGTTAGTVAEGNHTHGSEILNVALPDWNMDTTASITITGATLGINVSSVIFASAWIRNDTDSQNYVPLSIHNGDGYETIDRGLNYIVLNRRTSGIFDNSGYDSTSYSRGFLTILHT